MTVSDASERKKKGKKRRMIITVTLNPAIDKTAEIEEIHLRALNRLPVLVTDVGGKGINVSKTVASLGGRTIACGFIAGHGGDMLEEMLKNQGISTDFVRIEGETRTNLKLMEPGGYLTELNESGPEITESALAALENKLEKYADQDTVFVFSGSVGNGSPHNVYAKMIGKVKEKGAKVLLDADGPAFAEALKACPDLVKPNEFELMQYFHKEGTPSEEELVDMGKTLVDGGISTVCISRGSKGAVFFGKDRANKDHVRVIWAEGLQVEVHSTVGAGDAMAAALAYGTEQGESLEVCARMAMAASAGAVTTEGTKPPAPDLIQKLMEQVKLEER